MTTQYYGSQRCMQKCTAAVVMTRLTGLLPLLLLWCMHGVEGRTVVGTLDQGLLLQPVVLGDGDGDVGSAAMVYPGAVSVKVRVSQLSPGAAVVVTDGDGKQAQTLRAAGEWSLTTFGDRVRVTLKEEEDVSHPFAGHRRAVVDQAYRGTPAHEEEATTGEEDGGRRKGRTESVCGADQRKEAACWGSQQAQYTEEYERSRAVARVVMPCEPGPSSSMCTCTGWRVKGGQEGNLLITNNHCISDASQVPASEVFFRFENSRCGGSDASSRQVAVKVKEVLVTSSSLDMTLLSIKDVEKVSEFGVLELDVRKPVKGEQIYIPQHPGGRDKEIAITTDGGSRCTVDHSSTRNGLDIGYNCDTEGGSSGSPVLAASSHKVIALHHLGGCYNEGARVDQFYSLVSSHLSSSSSTGPTTPPPPPLSPPSTCPDSHPHFACGRCFTDADQASIGCEHH